MRRWEEGRRGGRVAVELFKRRKSCAGLRWPCTISTAAREVLRGQAAGEN